VDGRNLGRREDADACRARGNAGKGEVVGVTEAGG
jgi:hypothetical protein